jgi:hypothetical protein
MDNSKKRVAVLATARMAAVLVVPGGVEGLKAVPARSVGWRFPWSIRI